MQLSITADYVASRGCAVARMMNQGQGLLSKKKL